VLERLLRLEADRIERSTAELCGLFDEAVILNEDEAGQLRALAPGAAIRLLPPYKSRPATVTPRRWHGDPLFVILGNLGYAANEAALQQFIALALPEIRRSMPQARIAVVGAGGSAKLIEQIRAVGPPLEYQGYVEDLGAVLSNAAALLAPITIGSGVKIKILDALAYGLPVVTTPLGVSGTNLRDGAEVLIAERIEDFPAKMARLLDRATNDRMSATVRLHFEAVYSQSATENAYRECILGAPDGPAPNVRTLQAG
jgi:glycosyltransferase involved in cell wall biosynthesis